MPTAQTVKKLAEMNRATEPRATKTTFSINSMYGVKIPAKSREKLSTSYNIIIGLYQTISSPCVT